MIFANYFLLKWRNLALNPLFFYKPLIKSILYYVRFEKKLYLFDFIFGSSMIEYNSSTVQHQHGNSEGKK